MKRLAVGVAIAAMVLGGCEGFREERGRGDAPVGSYNDDPADITNMPDKFGNIATKCLHGADNLRLVMNSAQDTGFFAVVEDESC